MERAAKQGADMELRLIRLLWGSGLLQLALHAGAMLRSAHGAKPVPCPRHINFVLEAADPATWLVHRRSLETARMLNHAPSNPIVPTGHAAQSCAA